MSETKKPWKSRLLDSLGVKSTAIQASGPSGKACGLALAAAFTVAMGGASMDVHAGDKIKKETASEAASTVAYSVIGIEEGDSLFMRTGKVVTSIGKVVISPQTEVLSLGAQAAVGSAAGAQTKSSSQGMHAAEVIGTAAGIVAAAPVFGTLMVINQARNTYLFVQEEQRKAVELKMEEVTERVASVQDQYTQEIRMEDRANRQSWPEDRKAFDQKRMYNLAVESTKLGAELSEEVQIRYDIEQSIADAGGKPETWFTEYSRVKGELAAGYEAETKQMLADATNLDDQKVAGTVIEKIDMAAAFGGSGLKTSNKNFGIYSKEASKKQDRELGL
jgi:hypothetical protein